MNDANYFTLANHSKWSKVIQLHIQRVMLQNQYFYTNQYYKNTCSDSNYNHTIKVASQQIHQRVQKSKTFNDINMDVSPSHMYKNNQIH